MRCFFLCTLIIILLSCLSGFALQVCTIDQQRKVERRLSCNYRRRHGVCLATTEALYICIDSFFFFSSFRARELNQLSSWQTSLIYSPACAGTALVKQNRVSAINLFRPNGEEASAPVIQIRHKYTSLSPHVHAHAAVTRAALFARSLVYHGDI